MHPIKNVNVGQAREAGKDENIPDLFQPFNRDFF
jgi:hypothetical protein